MLRLYYSGGVQTGQMQRNPNQSLGGYISSTPIPNDSFDALFGVVSEKSVMEGLSETKAIFVKNEGDEALNEITIYCKMPEDAICKFEFSPVVVANQKAMERIPDVRSNPFYADFFEANGDSSEDSELILTTLGAGEIFGLWIRRTILPRSPMPEDQNPFELWLEHIKNKVENIEIVLGWE